MTDSALTPARPSSLSLYFRDSTLLLPLPLLLSLLSLRPFSPSSQDLLTLPTAACMTEGFSFSDMLFAKTLGPLLITFMLAVPALVVALRGWKYSIPIVDQCTRQPLPGASSKRRFHWKWCKKQPE
eukprot:3907910-Rhodomonas_salina.1